MRNNKHNNIKQKAKNTKQSIQSFKKNIKN